jgi:hypothetical protein
MVHNKSDLEAWKPERFQPIVLVSVRKIAKRVDGGGIYIETLT